MAGNKPGVDHQLDNKELLGRIKKAVFEGKNLKEIAEASGMSEATLYTYHSANVRSIADKIEGWRRDSKLAKADQNIDQILGLDVTQKDYTKVVADMSKFVKQALDKANYSNRTEHTGADGKDLPTAIHIITDGSNTNTKF